MFRGFETFEINNLQCFIASQRNIIRNMAIIVTLSHHQLLESWLWHPEPLSTGRLRRRQFRLQSGDKEHVLELPDMERKYSLVILTVSS
jgi:hypothetical protein